MRFLVKAAPAFRYANAAPDGPVSPRLITPDEAIGQIRRLLTSPRPDDRQYLLSIAGTAIAAVIVLDPRDAIEIEEIMGLQEAVNRALFHQDA